MEQHIAEAKASKKRTIPITQKRFLLFSIIPFAFILIASSIGFILSMRHIIHTNTRTELLQTVEIQRFSLEASVNNEIAIVLEMANSPLIMQHFLNPADEALRRIAFDEIYRFSQALVSGRAFWVSDVDRVFFMGEDISYLVDPDNPANPWYNRTMFETEVFNFNINYNPDLQVTNFWINAPVFDFDGMPIGLLGTGTLLTEFIDTIYRNHRGAARLYFFNALGEITGAPDTQLVADRVILDSLLPTTGPKILDWVSNYSPYYMRTFSGSEGEIAVCPIPAVGWYIVAIQPLSLADYLGTGMTYFFLIIMGVLIVFFIILQIGKYAFDTLSRTRQELRIERDFIAAMKDNLSVGLFMMDKDLVIQGSYSKPLESILGDNEVEGKKLTDFLTNSINTKELNSMKDYFDMVLTRQFDTKMLEEINPIAEFTYIDTNIKEEKIIKTVFSSVDMGSSNYILGNIEDISATRKLERQLAEETARREEEMRTLFQVIQVDPVIFNDFIEDTEYEFKHINETLKNSSILAKDAMVDIYQSIHAIKSNAIILGFDSFSAKLHELESIIKTFRDSGEVTFENTLHVAVELEKIMREKDKFQDIVSKVEFYKATVATAGENASQEQYVLTEALSKACEKAALAMNKKVDFSIDNLDSSILEKSHRRIIKEVLIQLVRNAVSHGIESPEERTAIGKKAEGSIQLAITRENNQVYIKLSDDGKGLNFKEIREKALSLKLLREENAEDQGQLIKALFSPGFSTTNATDIHAGRGIGLNLVRGRIKDLQGNIKVSSKYGKGTTFHLYIPIEAKAASA
ncbi:MAG: ATP-binding protein [Spirochaetaceae bacterium]|nr:ATP-binding protein [Spirochaetaceae bacterium]